MIVDEIGPIIDELSRLKAEINEVNTKVVAGISSLEAKEETEHKHMY